MPRSRPRGELAWPKEPADPIVGVLIAECFDILVCLTSMADHPDKLATKVDATSARFEKNMRSMAELVSTFRNEEEQIGQGGGPKAIESQHGKGRLTARERVDLLIDPKTEFFELGIYAAYEMYEEWGGAPAAGVV